MCPVPCTLASKLPGVFFTLLPLPSIIQSNHQASMHTNKHAKTYLVSHIIMIDYNDELLYYNSQ